MRECKHDGVENGSQFCSAGWDLGPKRSDQVPVSERPDDHNSGIWTPDGNPQEHIGNSNLGDFQLCTLLGLKNKTLNCVISAIEPLN